MAFSCICDIICAFKGGDPPVHDTDLFILLKCFRFRTFHKRYIIHLKIKTVRAAGKIQTPMPTQAFNRYKQQVNVVDLDRPV